MTGSVRAYHFLLALRSAFMNNPTNTKNSIMLRNEIPNAAAKVAPTLLTAVSS